MRLNKYMKAAINEAYKGINKHEGGPFGYAIGKRCYGFKTDTRSIQHVLYVNPMITGYMIKVFKNFDGDELIKEIREYLSNNKL